MLYKSGQQAHFGELEEAYHRYLERKRVQWMRKVNCSLRKSQTLVTLLGIHRPVGIHRPAEPRMLVGPHRLVELLGPVAICSHRIVEL